MNKNLRQHNLQCIVYPEVGKVTYVRSCRAKYIRLTIQPEGTVTVTLPHRATLHEAKSFFHSKLPWVHKQLGKIRKASQFPDSPPMSEREFMHAQKKMLDRLRELAGRHGFLYNRVTVRCQKTKWGSCSGMNNINLNVNLIFLPDELRDYVLLHELAHTRHKNHSPKFWSELDTLCGGKARHLRKELQNHRMKIA